MAPQDPFDALGIPPSYRIEDAEIRRAWRRRALDAHPDREGDASRSADVNAALQVLRDPIARAEALLRRFGWAEGADPPAAPELLSELIELRERLDESSGAIDEVRSIQAEAQARLAGVLGEIASAFDAITGPPMDTRTSHRVRALLGAARALRRVLEHVDAAVDAARRS